MIKLRLTAIAAVLLAVLQSAPSMAEANGADWERQVTAISKGADSAARAAAISEQLDALGIAWHAESFTREGKRGNNLVANLDGNTDAPLLLIGAHYDRVATGHGATDNASGVSTALALAAALHAQPLATHRVQVVFWDLEEEGLLGAHAWVATPGRERPALYVNFDVFGWGDTLWMMTPRADEPLAAIMARQSNAASLGFNAGEKYPPTDHLAFLAVDWPAVSFSLVGAEEVDSILAVFSGAKPDPAPKVMQVIHSAADTVDALVPGDIPLALKVLEAGLREWDAAE